MKKRKLEHQREVQDVVAQLRPIDDIMFQRLCENILLIEEVLRVILEDGKIKVKSVIPQSSIQNLHGRSVVLDAYCKLGDGSYCNVEVQRSDSDNHFKRVRYNAACITANVTDPGERFEQVKDLIVVYISEFDVFHGKATIYHTRMRVDETGAKVPDGYQAIYVNTKNNDGSRIAELMQCFLQTEIDNPNFPILAEELRAEKGNIEGDEAMCKIVEDYAEKRAQERGREERAEGKVQGMQDTLIALVKKNLLALTDAAKEANMSESEFMKLVQG